MKEKTTETFPVGGKLLEHLRKIIVDNAPKNVPRLFALNAVSQVFHASRFSVLKESHTEDPLFKEFVRNVEKEFLYLSLKESLMAKRPKCIGKIIAFAIVRDIYEKSEFFRADVCRKNAPQVKRFIADVKKEFKCIVWRKEKEKLLELTKKSLIHKKPKNICQITVEAEFDRLYEQSPVCLSLPLKRKDPDLLRLVHAVEETLEFISQNRKGEFDHCSRVYVDKGAQVSRAPNYDNIPFYNIPGIYEGVPNSDVDDEDDLNSKLEDFFYIFSESQAAYA